MTFAWFMVVFAVSGAAMALWIDNRFPGLAPESLRTALLRLVGGFLLIQLSLAAVDHMVGVFATTTRAAVVLTVAFVLLTIAFLTAIWLIKVAQRMMGGSVR